MSFGYGVGDFLATIQLINSVRKRFINAPAQFKALSEEVKTLSNVLRDIEDIEPDEQLSDKQKQHLNTISQKCKPTLHNLEHFLDAYQEIECCEQNIRGISRRVWKKLKWDESEMHEFQQQLHGQVQVFSLFLQGLNIQISLSTKEVASLTKDGVDKVNKYQDDQRRQHILDWISPINSAAQQRDLLDRRQEGTGQWLLSTNEFQQWLNDKQQVLFCPGIPGAGKTILSSVIVDYLESNFNHKLDVGIAFLHCNFRQVQEQRSRDLLASILKQLAQALPEIPEPVMDLYDRHQKKQTLPKEQELSVCLHKIAGRLSKIFLVVDALDECENYNGSRDKLLSVVGDLQTQWNLSFLATSRYIPEIMEKFEGKPSLEIRATPDDVKRYLRSNLHRLPSFVSRNQELQHIITRQISEAVDGMFLLAQLHLNSLIGKNSRKAVLKVLKSLPTGTNAYDSAYADAMKRVEGQVADQREMAKQILSWITCSRTRLKTHELQHALAVEIGEEYLDEDNIPEIEDMISVCAGLVTVDKQSNIIKLVHYTTQEYFERNWISHFPNAHHDIANICITYLSFQCFEAGSCPSDEEFEMRLYRYPLYRYSAANWAYHCRLQKTDMELALNLVKSRAKIEACIQGAMTIRLSRRVPKQMKGLHFAAYYGLVSLVQKLIENDTQVDVKDSWGRSPLSWAAENGYHEVVKLLLEKGANAEFKDRNLRTPLSMAAMSGYDTVVKILLDYGADPTSRDKDGLNPLSLAAKWRRDSVIELILYQGLRPEGKDLHGRSTLSFAAEHGEYSLVKSLLDQGVDPDSKDGDGRTPLSWAVCNRQVRIADILLERGADPKSKDNCDRTALMWAAARGCTSGIILLCSGITDLNGKDRFGRTPLIAAAACGHLSSVKTLLSINGVNIHITDNFGRNAMVEAGKRGYLRIVELLRATEDPHYQKKGVCAVEHTKAKFLKNISCIVCLTDILEDAVHYNCQVCNGGNLSICEQCIQDGASCFNNSHKLVEVPPGIDYEFFLFGEEECYYWC